MGRYKLNGDDIAGFSRDSKDILFDKTGTSYSSDDVDGVLREIDDSLSDSIDLSAYAITGASMQGMAIKIKNIVILNFIVDCPSGYVGNAGIATLPSAYRPTAVKSGGGCALNANNVTNSARIRVNTNGKLYADSAQVIQQFSGTIIYTV